MSIGSFTVVLEDSYESTSGEILNAIMYSITSIVDGIVSVFYELSNQIKKYRNEIVIAIIGGLVINLIKDHIINRLSILFTRTRRRRQPIIL